MLSCCFRSLALVVSFSVTVSLTSTTRADDELVRVFLLAGQSNMVGADAHAARIDDFPVFRGAGQPQDDVLYSYAVGGVAPAGEIWSPLRPLSAFGPELTFASRVKKSSPGRIAIIKSAVGGTTVAYDWNPDAPAQGQKLYPRTLQLVRDSLAELDRRQIRYRLEAVLWHQGENDMLDRKLYPTYAEGLTKLIERFRQDLGAPQLPFYIAEVSEKGIWGMDHRANLAALRAQQETVLQQVAGTHWVPTSHLAFEVMGSGQPHYHYGTQGQLQLGEAFAQAYLKEIKRLPPPTDRRLTGRLPFPPGARVRLLVFAGQRNMEGEDAFLTQLADTPEFKSLTLPRSDIPFRFSLGGGVKQSSDWEPLAPVDYLGEFGPELSFGAAIRSALAASEGVAIVKFTHSGAQGPDWLPDGSPESRRNLYPRFSEFVKAAQSDLLRQGFQCQLGGVFWHTGENDTYFGPYAQNHARWLKQLIDRTRTDWQAPDLPWFVSEQPSKAPWRNQVKVNGALRDLASSDANLHVIPTDQLPHGKNLFGAEGLVRLGEAYAQAYRDAAR